MTERIVQSEHDRKMILAYLTGLKLPFTVSVTQGKRRSVEQNKLQRLWMNEISEQLGDQTPEEVRGYCKLAIAVPLLRAENEKFAEHYDRVVKPLPYETKLAIMQEPLDLPVTRIMTTRQKAQYLDMVYRHWTEKGIVLTNPDDTKFGEAA